MNDHFLKVAKQAAVEAGKVISQYIGKKHQYQFKNQDQSDFSTRADLQAEQKIVEILTKNFPETSIIAEESGQASRTSEYTWVIDPIDGTTSFAAGMFYFAVSIGLLKGQEPILGVVYHVMNNDLYWAQKGQGAYLNGKSIHVNQKTDLNSAVFAMDFGHKKRRLPKIDLYIVPILKQAGYVYAVGSTVMSLVLVASGVQDGMSSQAWLWDVIAGAVIVKEAGGRVTDFAGKELDWTQQRFDILATNGLIHDEILEALKT